MEPASSDGKVKLSSKRISEALNDANSLGLHGQDFNNLHELIIDYFGEDRDSSDDELPESDDDEADEIGLDLNDEEDDDWETMQISDSDGEDDVEEEVVVNIDPGLDIVRAHGMDQFMSEEDIIEMNKISNLKCRCKKPFAGLGCSHKFPDEQVFRMRYQINALSHANKTMFLLGKIATGGVKVGGTTKSKKKKRTERKRKRVDMGYYIDGKRVCRDTFVYMHMTSDKVLSKLVNHYVTNGIEVMRKRSGGVLNNKKAFAAEDVIRTVNYITQYAEKYGMVIPGRVPGFKTADPRVRLLPCKDTKASVWRTYKKHFEDMNMATGNEYRLVKRSSFYQIWHKYTPFVLTTRPRTDLCWTCQRHNQRIYQSANEPEDMKAERLAKQVEHLRVVRQEREVYQQHVMDAKESISRDPATLQAHQPCSRQGVIHYSFDYAQQVHYPHDPDQPGPVYFMTPRKCGVFGINCEGLTRQVNFLVDEGMTIGKGSNAVLSYIHFYFDHYGLGEETVQLHCDNCSGQNKNKYAMWYMAWRCLYNLHKQVQVFFLIAGHTKFSPDWCFGLFKQRYRRSHISALSDIEEACRSSTVTGVNIPQLIGTEDGRVVVPTYDWQAFFSAYFRPLTGIKSLHHMRFDSNFPGMVFFKEYADSPEDSMQLLKDPSVLPPPPTELPEPLSPPGLSYQRQKYLYENIRQFCAQDGRADLTCPAPSRT